MSMEKYIYNHPRLPVVHSFLFELNMRLETTWIILTENYLRFKQHLSFYSQQEVVTPNHARSLWFVYWNGNIAILKTVFPLTASEIVKIASGAGNDDHLVEMMTHPFQCCSLQWRHNGRVGVSNLQPHNCLPNCLFGYRSKKTSKLHVTGLCEGNSPVTGDFPAQRDSNAENVSIWWRHHAELLHCLMSVKQLRWVRVNNLMNWLRTLHISKSKTQILWPTLDCRKSQFHKL